MPAVPPRGSVGDREERGNHEVEHFMDLVPNRRRTIWVLAALVFVVGLGSIAYVAWEWPSWQAAREIRLLFAKGRYAEASRAAHRWIKIRPNAAEAQFDLAKSAIALGNRAQTLEGMKQAKALGYPEAKIALLRALLDAQAGRLNLALPVLMQAFDAMREPDPMLEEALARVLMDSYDWPNAVRVLASWAKDAPDDARPYLWRAAVNLRREVESKDVIADYREALRRAPQLPEALIGLANELAHGFKYEEAATLYHTYLDLRPDDPLGQLGAGITALGLGDLSSAGQRIDRALELDSTNAPAHLERAKIDLLQGNLTSALKHFDKSIESSPYDLAVHYSRKMTLTRLGRLDDAVAEQRSIDALKADLGSMNDLRARLTDSPHDVRLQSQLAHWMFDHGYAQEGVNWSKKILNESPGHRETCILLANYFDSQGQTELANQYRSQIGRTRPQNQP